MSTHRRWIHAGLAVVMSMGMGCGADPAPADLGHVTLALSPLEDAGWLRLRLFEGAVDQELMGDELYDTGCLEVLSESYDLRNMPAGEDRTVVIEGFSAVGCPADRRMALGMRGEISIPTSDPAPYYHVPIYGEPGITPLPEALNISETTAVPVSYCDAADDCAGLLVQDPACYKSVDTGEARYWCVPTCVSNSDCATLHPKATCEQTTGWCMMYHPFPLNMSSPRAFGHAFSMADGGVAFVGGFGTMAAGRLAPASGFGERFDPHTGIFAHLEGDLASPSFGMSGAAQMDDHRVILAGGVGSVLLKWEGSGESTTLDLSKVESKDLRSELIVWSPDAGTLTKNALPVAIAAPTVVPISANQFLVLGGAVGTPGQGGPVMASNAIFRCALSESDEANCTKAGILSTPRHLMAASCVDSPCTKVLVLGGHGEDGPAVEVLRFEGDNIVSSLLELTPSMDGFHQPALCGTILVGGADHPLGVGGHEAVSFQVGASSVAWDALASPVQEELTILPAVATTQGGGCWVFGGVDGQGQASEMVFRVEGGSAIHSYLEESGAMTDYALHTPRYGAMGAEVTAGPLAGTILVGGGLTLAGGGAVSYVRGAEILRP